MDLNKLIQQPEYDFLRTNPHLGKNILLLGVGGSLSYGTNTPDSDVDIRGIAANTQSDLLGLSSFDQAIDNPTDTVVYGLNKIFKLMLDCNPNVIELLGLLPEHYIYIHPIAQELLDHKDLFISKKAIKSFAGYASQQLWRIKSVLKGSDMDAKERELQLYKTITNNMAHFHNKYHDFSDQDIVLYIDQSEQEEMETEIFMDINLRHYPLRDYRSMWNEMNNIVKDYDKIGKRNKKKDTTHLMKHMMHLIRLLIMGTEILATGEVHTYRCEEHELLMSIRNGSFGTVDDDFWKLVNEYMTMFDEATAKTQLPEKPDYERANQLLIHLNQRVLKEVM